MAVAVPPSLWLGSRRSGHAPVNALAYPLLSLCWVAIFLSYSRAAEELHLHTNSIKYRVQRAIDRRGRPISDGRLDVEIALLLCHWYGTAVLHDE